MSGTIFVFLEPMEGVDDFNNWRATAFDHIPGITTKIILSATDTVDKSRTYRYLNLYEVEDIHRITENLMDSLLSTSSTSDYIQDSSWHRYSMLSTFKPEEKSMNREPRSTSLVVTVGMTIQETPDALADFHAWYTDEHMPGMATVPGWQSGSRYHLCGTFGSDKEYSAPFLAVHKWERENGLGGDIWRNVVFTPWTKRSLETHTAPMQRRTWKVLE